MYESIFWGGFTEPSGTWLGNNSHIYFLHEERIVTDIVKVPQHNIKRISQGLLSQDDNCEMSSSGSETKNGRERERSHATVRLSGKVRRWGGAAGLWREKPAQRECSPQGYHWTPGSISSPMSLLWMHRTASFKSILPKGSLSALGALGRRLRVLASWGYGMVRMASWVVSPQEGRSEHPWGGRVPSSRAGTGPWAPSQQSVLSRKQIRSPLGQGACSRKLITSGGLGSFPAFVGSQSLQVYSFSECAW